MADMTPKEVTDTLKLAIKEWLDDKFATLGRWTLRGLAAAGLAAIAFLIITANGWGSK